MGASSIAQYGAFQKIDPAAYRNFLVSKYEMLTARVEVSSLPYCLLVEPSDVCQLRCPTCVTGIENQSRLGATPEPVIYRAQREMLTPELFDALLEEMGRYLFLIVFYNFGEPLLNRRLPEFIRKASALGIETDINTNLSLPLSDERIEGLLTAGLGYLSASIDGFTQETYQIHRVGGNLALAKQNLERITAARDRLGSGTCITYNFLVFRHNEHEIEAARAYSTDLGINFNARDAFLHNRDWLPSYRAEEKPWEIPEEVSLPDGFNTKIGGKAVAWSPLPRSHGARTTSSCSWHYGFSVVSAGGAITPCCFVPSERYDFGRLDSSGGSFARVWNNENLRKSRAVVSGQVSEELEDVRTVCERCPAPQFIHHLYSLHDFKVVAQFHRVLSRSQPVLAGAFDLFCQARYGIRPHQLFRNGELCEPPSLIGSESDRPDAVRAFLEYVERELIQASDPVDRESQDQIAPLVFLT